MEISDLLAESSSDSFLRKSDPWGSSFVPTRSNGTPAYHQSLTFSATQDPKAGWSHQPGTQSPAASSGSTTFRPASVLAGPPARDVSNSTRPVATATPRQPFASSGTLADRGDLTRVQKRSQSTRRGSTRSDLFTTLEAELADIERRYIVSGADDPPPARRGSPLRHRRPANGPASIGSSSGGSAADRPPGATRSSPLPASTSKPWTAPVSNGPMAPSISAPSSLIALVDALPPDGSGGAQGRPAHQPPAAGSAAQWPYQPPAAGSSPCSGPPSREPLGPIPTASPRLEGGAGWGYTSGDATPLWPAGAMAKTNYVETVSSVSTRQQFQANQANRSGEADWSQRLTADASAPLGSGVTQVPQAPAGRSGALSPAASRADPSPAAGVSGARGVVGGLAAPPSVAALAPAPTAPAAADTLPVMQPAGSVVALVRAELQLEGSPSSANVGIGAVGQSSAAGGRRLEAAAGGGTASWSSPSRLAELWQKAAAGAVLPGSSGSRVLTGLESMSDDATNSSDSAAAAVDRPNTSTPSQAAPSPPPSFLGGGSGAAGAGARPETASVAAGRNAASAAPPAVSLSGTAATRPLQHHAGAARSLTPLFDLYARLEGAATPTGRTLPDAEQRWHPQQRPQEPGSRVPSGAQHPPLGPVLGAGKLDSPRQRGQPPSPQQEQQQPPPQMPRRQHPTEQRQRGSRWPQQLPNAPATAVPQPPPALWSKIETSSSLELSIGCSVGLGSLPPTGEGSRGQEQEPVNSLVTRSGSGGNNSISSKLSGGGGRKVVRGASLLELLKAEMESDGPLGGRASIVSVGLPVDDLRNAGGSKKTAGAAASTDLQAGSRHAAEGGRRAGRSFDETPALVRMLLGLGLELDRPQSGEMRLADGRVAEQASSGSPHLDLQGLQGGMRPAQLLQPLQPSQPLNEPWHELQQPETQSHAAPLLSDDRVVPPLHGQQLRGLVSVERRQAPAEASPDSLVQRFAGGQGNKQSRIKSSGSSSSDSPASRGDGVDPAGGPRPKLRGQQQQQQQQHMAQPHQHDSHFEQGEVPQQRRHQQLQQHNPCQRQSQRRRGHLRLLEIPIPQEEEPGHHRPLQLQQQQQQLDAMLAIAAGQHEPLSAGTVQMRHGYPIHAPLGPMGLSSYGSGPRGGELSSFGGTARQDLERETHRLPSPAPALGTDIHRPGPPDTLSTAYRDPPRTQMSSMVSEVELEAAEDQADAAAVALLEAMEQRLEAEATAEAMRERGGAAGGSDADSEEDLLRQLERVSGSGDSQADVGRVVAGRRARGSGEEKEAHGPALPSADLVRIARQAALRELEMRVAEVQARYNARRQRRHAGRAPEAPCAALPTGGATVWLSSNGWPLQQDLQQDQQQDQQHQEQHTYPSVSSGNAQPSDFLRNILAYMATPAPSQAPKTPPPEAASAAASSTAGAAAVTATSSTTCIAVPVGLSAGTASLRWASPRPQVRTSGSGSSVEPLAPLRSASLPQQGWASAAATQPAAAGHWWYGGSSPTATSPALRSSSMLGDGAATSAGGGSRALGTAAQAGAAAGGSPLPLPWQQASAPPSPLLLRTPAAAGASNPLPSAARGPAAVAAGGQHSLLQGGLLSRLEGRQLQRPPGDNIRPPWDQSLAVAKEILASSRLAAAGLRHRVADGLWQGPAGEEPLEPASARCRAVSTSAAGSFWPAAPRGSLLSPRPYAPPPPPSPSAAHHTFSAAGMLPAGFAATRVAAGGRTHASFCSHPANTGGEAAASEAAAFTPTMSARKRPLTALMGEPHAGVLLRGGQQQEVEELRVLASLARSLPDLDPLERVQLWERLEQLLARQLARSPRSGAPGGRRRASSLSGGVLRPPVTFGGRGRGVEGVYSRQNSPLWSNSTTWEQRQRDGSTGGDAIGGRGGGGGSWSTTREHQVGRSIGGEWLAAPSSPRLGGSGGGGGGLGDRAVQQLPGFLSPPSSFSAAAGMGVHAGIRPGLGPGSDGRRSLLDSTLEKVHSVIAPNATLAHALSLNWQAVRSQTARAGSGRSAAWREAPRIR